MCAYLQLCELLLMLVKGGSLSYTIQRMDIEIALASCYNVWTLKDESLAVNRAN